MQSTYFLRANSTGGGLTGSVANTLYDIDLAETAQLPAGALVKHVYIFGTATLTEGVSLQVGIVNWDDCFATISDAVTTDKLNANSYVIAKGKILPSPGEATDIIVTPDANTSGAIELYIEYVLEGEVASNAKVDVKKKADL